MILSLSTVSGTLSEARFDGAGLTTSIAGALWKDCSAQPRSRVVHVPMYDIGSSSGIHLLDVIWRYLMSPLMTAACKLKFALSTTTEPSWNDFVWKKSDDRLFARGRLPAVTSALPSGLPAKTNSE